MGDPTPPFGTEDGATPPFTAEEEPGTAPPEPEEGLTLRAAKGISWGALFQVLAQPITLLTSIAMARLLTPDAFGVMSMAGIVMGLIALLNEFGLGSAVVQKHDLDDLELDSLFWFNLGVGVAFTLIGLVMARPVAAYFREPILVPVFAVLSLSFTISSISTVHMALLTRRMEFRPLATYGFLGTVATAGVGVGFAVAGAGVWSLVFSSLLGPIVPVVLVWRRVKWRPEFRFSWASCSRLVRFGANVTISTLVNYGSSNVDYMIIGRSLGAAALGVYTLAFNLMLFPFRKFSALLVSATYPAFSRIQHERERFSNAYLRSSALLSLVAAPILLSALVAAPELIVGLYGPKWSDAIVPLQILTLAGIQKSVGTMVGVVFRGMGRPEVEARWGVLNLVALAAGVLVGVRWGTPGVALAVTIVSWAVGVPTQVRALRLLGTPFSAYVRAVIPGAAAGIAALAAAAAVRLMAAPLPDLINAGLTGIAGLAAAAAVSWLFWRPIVADLFGIISGVWKSRGSGRRAAEAEAAARDV